MTISVWVPGTIPPGMIERAIEAAWPGTHTITAPATTPLPAGGLATGGRLRLARPEILPLKTDHPADPLRALAAAGHRPGRRRARDRPGAGPARHRGAAAPRPPRHPRACATASPPGCPPGCWTPSPPAGRMAPGPPPPAPTRKLAADLRAALAKAAGPQWETQIRYAVTTTTCRAPGRARRAAATRRPAARLRGLAHALASATALYAGRNWLARRHLPRPDRPDHRPPVPPR